MISQQPSKGPRAAPGAGSAWTLAAMVLGVGLALSATAAWLQHRTNERQIDNLLAAEVAAVAERLERRLLLAEHGLRAARGVVLASGGPDRLPFSVYLSTDSLEREYPGVRGFGLVRQVVGGPGDELSYIVQFVDPPSGNELLSQADLRRDPDLHRLADSAAIAGQVLAGAPRRLSSGDLEFIALLGVRQPGRNVTDWVLASLSGPRLLAGLTGSPGPTLLRVHDLATDAQFGVGEWPAQCAHAASVERFVFSRRWSLGLCADEAWIDSLRPVPPLGVLGGGGVASALLAGLAYTGRMGRRRRQEAETQRARLAALVAQSSDAIVTVDADGLIQSWNAAAVQLFGWRADEALGGRLDDLLVPAEAQPQDLAQRRRVLAGERPQALDTRWRRRDGALVDLSVSLAPLLDADGDAHGVMLSVRDIGQRKALERELLGLNDRLAEQVAARTAELEAARHNLQDVIDGLPSLVAYFDDALVCRFANKAHREWLGQDPDALPGQPLHALMDAETFAYVRPVMQRALDGQDESVYRDFPRLGGGMRRVLAHYRGDRRDGRIVGVYVLIHDVDELHRIQQALDHERERLANIVLGTGAGTWEWDLVSGQVVINARMAQMLGRAPELPLVLHQDEWSALSHPDDLPLALQRQVGHWKGLTPLYEVEMRVRHADGHWLWLRSSGRVARRDAQGRALDMHGILLDISQRKAIEAELQHARESAERASLAKSQFLANMSHEIRTPLNAVIGLAYLFADTSLTEPQRVLVGKIQLAGRALLALVNDVLDLSKIEAGELGLQQAPFHLGGLLDDVHRLLGAQAESKGLDFRLDADPALPAYVKGDELRLRQIVVNLLSNAIKFTEHGGVTLRARARPTEPGAADGLLRLRLEVQDTGIGIAPDLQGSLFRPFTQVDASPTRRFKGTGLGLSIVRELSQLMGGEVGVLSTPGLGSTFWVELPLALAEPTDAPGDAQPLAVLLADDHPQERDELSRMARSLGWMVEAVDDGDALVRRATDRLREGRPPDALLVDWRMPGRDGLAALQALVSVYAPGPVPAAVIVSVSEATQVMAAPGADLAAAVLTKPVHPSTLFNAVNTAVARQAGSHERLLASTRMDLGQTLWLPGVQVLVVDDSDVNRDVARHLLERQGAVVDEAVDGQQALDRLTERRYDAVLMDVQMPVLDGNEATRRLRRQPVLADLPVIALTAGALLNERQQALDAGMSDFLTKPLDPVTLVRTVRRQVERVRGEPLPTQSRPDAPQEDDGWPPIPGLHLAEARERLGHDRALFLRLLRRLIDEHLPRLKALVPGAEANADAVAITATATATADDARAWAAQMHKLRGAAGTLGARELHRLAGQAEWAAAQPDAAHALAEALPAVAQALQQLADDANPWLRAAAAPATPAPPPDPTQVLALRDRLQQRDLGVLDLWRQLEPGLRGWLGSAVSDQLERHIDALDFAAADALLARAAEGHAAAR